MKTRIKPIIQYAMTAILFFSWLDYQSIVSDRAAFEMVQNKNLFYNSSTRILKYSADNLIRKGERRIESYPNRKFVFERMKNVKSIIDELVDRMNSLQYGFYEVNEIEIDWKLDKKYRESVPLPTDYNQTENIIEFFLEREEAVKLSRAIEESIKELNEVCKIDEKQAILSDSLVRDHNIKQINLLKSEDNVIAYILNIQQFKKDIQHYDVLHAYALMNALKYELRLLELELLQNMFDLIDVKKEIETDIMYVFSMLQPQANGKVQKLEIYPMTYIKSNQLDISLNGKPLDVKDGIATFKYTPKKAGEKYFRTEFMLKSPFTGKTTILKKGFKNYAID